MARIEIDKEKWIKNTALLFYQIFSVDYEDEAFINKLLSGGGGNSTLCSTWNHLNEYFIKYRITENAYNLLLEKISEEHKNMIILRGDTVYISKKLRDKKHYHGLFENNAKGAENRANAGKFFHFDHNPSNKKVLMILNEKIKEHRYDEEFVAELTDYIKTVQTIDLVTIYEDDTRTLQDLQNPDGPLSAEERDNLLETHFYNLVQLSQKEFDQLIAEDNNQ